jgi:hypothetical protein
MTDTDTDADATDDSKAIGVEFGDLDDELDEMEYPVEAEELLDDYGSETLEFEEGSATLEELLEPMGSQSFESKNSVQQAVLTMVGDEAIGRKNYSDRDPPTTGQERQDESEPGEDGEGGQESF